MGEDVPSETGLRRNVEERLVETGYPLEMRVAKVFRALDSLMVTQGGHYADLHSAAIRETDIEVLWMQLTERFAALALHLIVECKSGSQPWVLFADPQAAEYIDVVFYGLAVAASSEPDDDKLVDRVQQQIEDLGAPLFSGPSPACYGLAQMRTRTAGGSKRADERDGACDAVRQAASGAVGAVRDHKPNAGAPGFAYAVPVVVTTRPIFIASLSEEGDVVVKPAESGCLHIRPSGSHESVFVHVINEQALESFADLCQATGGVFERVMLEDGLLHRPARVVRRVVRRLAPSRRT